MEPMIYFITISCITLCVLTIVLGLKFYRENQELEPWRSELGDEEDESSGLK